MSRVNFVNIFVNYLFKQKIMTKKILKSLALVGGGIIIIALVLVVNYFVLSWTEPTGPPPSGSGSGWSKAYIVSWGEIIKYHDGCTSILNTATDLMNCIAACDRYCRNACVTNPSATNCNGGDSGLDYKGGTATEWDAISDIRCYCWR